MPKELSISEITRIARDWPEDENLALEQIKSELEVKDLLIKYGCCYDNNDIEGVMSVFHENCELINPRGTYIGKEAIRKNYDYLIERRKESRHNIFNQIVRLRSDCKEAWMTAYHMCFSSSKDSVTNGVAGAYESNLIKIDGNWQFVRHFITVNMTFGLSERTRLAVPTPPVPTQIETSTDIRNLSTDYR